MVIVAWSNYADGSIFKRSIIIQEYAEGSRVEQLEKVVELGIYMLYQKLHIIETFWHGHWATNVCKANCKQFGKTLTNRCALNVLQQTFAKRNENHFAKRNCAFH